MHPKLLDLALAASHIVAMPPVPLSERLRLKLVEQVRGVFNDADGGEAPVPVSDEALFAKDTPIRMVHADIVAMMVGGIRGLLLQMLHPHALQGVLDHSNFRSDMHGRLRRTARFIAVTTFGHRDDAQAIERVNEYMPQSGARCPMGRPIPPATCVSWHGFTSPRRPASSPLICAMCGPICPAPSKTNIIASSRWSLARSARTRSCSTGAKQTRSSETCGPISPPHPPHAKWPISCCSDRKALPCSTGHAGGRGGGAAATLRPNHAGTGAPSRPPRARRDMGNGQDLALGLPAILGERRRQLEQVDKGKRKIAVSSITRPPSASSAPTATPRRASPPRLLSPARG